MNAALQMQLKEASPLPVINEVQRRGELPDVEPPAHSASLVTLVVRTFLLCLLALAAIGARTDWDQVKLPAWWPWQMATPLLSAEVRPLVQHFDGTQRLRPGDWIVVGTPLLPRVRQVVAGPGEVLVLHRGESIDGFFMTGTRSFMVGAEEDGIVRANKIRGMIASNSKPSQ